MALLHTKLKNRPHTFNLAAGCSPHRPTQHLLAAANSNTQQSGPLKNSRNLSHRGSGLPSHIICPRAQ